jgi:hypothetical protein
MAQQPHRHGDPQLVKQSRFPWPMIALIVAGLMLLAILWLRPNRQLQSAPAGDTEVAVQPAANQVQFENINIVPSPTPAGAAGNNVTVQADLRSSADIPITGVMVEGIFNDNNGEAIYRQRQPVSAVEGGAKNAKEVPLNDSPIPRRGTRAVRITFSAVPTNWNKRPPQLTVTDVQSQGLAKPAEKQ